MGIRPKRSEGVDSQLAEARRRIAELEADLAASSRRDQLTQTLLTLRAFQTQLQIEIERAERYGHALSVIALDIVDFRALNAEHGYAVGDRVLVELGRLMWATTRSHDLVCRVGGDGFAILLSETGAEGAGCVCKRLTQGLADLEVEPVGGVSVSIGVAVLSSGQGTDELLAAAHGALDVARRQGGGPVFAEDEDDSATAPATE